jgi:hypothetical protein
VRCERCHRRCMLLLLLLVVALLLLQQLKLQNRFRVDD